MYNSNENNLDPRYFNSKTETICKRLRILMYCLFVVAMMRIASGQILWMISDLMSALIVYCTYSSKGKFSALFCFINAIMSALYAIIIGVENLNNQTKSNSQIKEGQVENKVEFNSSNDSNEFNMGRSQSVSLYPIFIVVTMIFALVTYTLIAYYSYQGFKYFQHPFGNIEENSNDEENRLIMQNRENQPGNYGAVNYGNRNQGNTDTWNGQSYRNNGYGLSSTQNNSNTGGNKIIPFSGRGTVVGGA